MLNCILALALSKRAPVYAALLTVLGWTVFFQVSGFEAFPFFTTALSVACGIGALTAVLLVLANHYGVGFTLEEGVAMTMVAAVGGMLTWVFITYPFLPFLAGWASSIVTVLISEMVLGYAELRLVQV